ncbi:MAG: hypothetical protein LUG50_09535 [Planctomycetaceae bacterium]|nr:hypothetical protein [Planctomycetaceae bacterium]
MGRFVRLVFLVAAFGAAAFADRTTAGEPDWSPLAVIRIGNIDALDAEDGDLALFIKSIRNDGRFIPPVRTLIGPEIRNPTFFGLTFETWLEGVLMVPREPGNPQGVWLFPVDSRDEYMSQLSSLGISEYEGMDGVTILREIDADGNVRTWYMEWLPGNIAVFGRHRRSVEAARALYAENSAARGLLAGPGGRIIEADVTVRLYPPRLSTWQVDEPGMYWWREKVDLITRDLLDYWQPGSARTRLMYALADRLALWPRSMKQMDLAMWFEPDGVEWRLSVNGDWRPAAAGQLETIRALPERTAMAYAVLVTVPSLAVMGDFAGDFLLAAAGGVVTQEARTMVLELFAAVLAGGPTEITAAWIAPPVNRPELGGARMAIIDMDRPEMVGPFWRNLLAAVQPGTPVSLVLSQIGLELLVVPETHGPGTAVVEAYPFGGVQRGDGPLHSALYVSRMAGSRLVVVGGGRPGDDDAVRRVAEYRIALADEAAANDTDGTADVRSVLTRMGPQGAAFLGLFAPVRFLQLALVETGDWRPRSPDQHEPESSQLAREMLEYGTARAWSVVGENSPGNWRFHGEITWSSLARLSAALGITESIGMDAP